MKQESIRVFIQFLAKARSQIPIIRIRPRHSLCKVENLPLRPERKVIPPWYEEGMLPMD